MPWLHLRYHLHRRRPEQHAEQVARFVGIGLRERDAATIAQIGKLKANVLEFMPPLTLTEDEVTEGVAIVDQAMADVSAGKVSDADVASFMMW